MDCDSLSGLSEADLTIQLSQVRADLRSATAQLRRCKPGSGCTAGGRAQLDRLVRWLTVRERRCVQLLNRQQFVRTPGSCDRRAGFRKKPRRNKTDSSRFFSSPLHSFDKEVDLLGRQLMLGCLVRCKSLLAEHQLVIDKLSGQVNRLSLSVSAKAGSGYISCCGNGATRSDNGCEYNCVNTQRFVAMATASTQTADDPRHRRLPSVTTTESDSDSDSRSCGSYLVETADRVLNEHRRLADERRRRLVDASDEPSRRIGARGAGFGGETRGEIDRRVSRLIRRLIPLIRSRFTSGCSVVSTDFLAWLRTTVPRLLLEEDQQQYMRTAVAADSTSELEDQLKPLLASFRGRSIDACLEDLLLTLSDAVYSELALRQLLGRIGDGAQSDTQSDSAACADSHRRQWWTFIGGFGDGSDGGICETSC